MARIRAIGFGPNGIDPVIEKMDRLAILDDHRIATAIGDSLADLMAQDMDTNAPIVLRHVAGWFEDRRRNRTAQWVFLSSLMSSSSSTPPCGMTRIPGSKTSSSAPVRPSPRCSAC